MVINTNDKTFGSFGANTTVGTFFGDNGVFGGSEIHVFGSSNIDTRGKDIRVLKSFSKGLEISKKDMILELQRW